MTVERLPTGAPDAGGYDVAELGAMVNRLRTVGRPASVMRQQLDFFRR
jgi:hypothetical protein